MPSNRDPERIAHFRIVGRLGQGGMGIVYRAEDERLRRAVALKVLPEAFAQDEERRARFLREARSAAALTHANIAAVHDVGEDAGRIYIAMELVEGQSLRERLAGGPLAPIEAVRIARGIARGLARAHAKGIVHRDLKPENVMLDAEGEPKILDFGLAKLHEQGEPSTKSAIESGETVQQITREGHLVGTPHYMSPEQAGGGAIDARTDVFSLGVVLYEMCSGARPFEANNVPELLARLLRDPPFPLREVAPDVPPPVVAVIERCLAKDPATRYADAGALVAALDDLAASGSLARPVAATIAPREAPRRVLVGAVAVLVGVLFIGGAARLLRTRGPAAAAAPAPPSSAAPPASARAVTDWPPPKTSSPEAATLYAEGMQAMRDAQPDITRAKLMGALAADPHFAAAHVRAVAFDNSQASARQHVAAAVDRRESLDARDQRLLAYWDTLTQMSTAPADRVRAAETLAADLPDDPEALYYAASFLADARRFEDSTRLYQHALQVDPKFALVLNALARLEWQRRDVAATEAAAQRCLAVSPRAASCVSTLAELHEAVGRCKELGRDADRLMDLEPTAAAPRRYKLDALSAASAPIEAIRHVMDEYLAKVQGGFAGQNPRVASGSDMGEAAIHEYTGDFAAAEADLLRVQKTQATEPMESGHTAEAALISLYIEEGAVAKEGAVGDDYLRRLPALKGDGGINSRLFALMGMRDSGRLPEARVRALREEWIAEVRAMATGLEPGQVWLYFWAALVETPAQAQEALAALPRFLPLPSLELDPQLAADVGAVYALAGDADHAIPLLQEAVNWCAPFFTNEEPDHLRARLMLGQALEQKGDTAGACEQYGAVLERWGHARPKSVTGDKARARSKALGCP